MKNPLKLARKEFPKYGAQLIFENNHTQQWRMPWREVYNVWHNLRIGEVRDMVAELREREDPLKDFVRCAPIALEGELYGSTHFTERFVLMGKQDGVTDDEIRDAYLSPEETRHCARYGTFAFIRNRIAVIAAPHKDGWKLVTLLWARPDLWFKNPRPERG